MKMKFERPTAFLVGTWIFIIWLFDTAGIKVVLAQNKCETALAEARKKYELGFFAEAINLLTPCLPNGIPELERVRAHRLLAMAYVAQDYPDKARAEIEK